MSTILERMRRAPAGFSIIIVVALYFCAGWLKVRLYDNNASALIGFGCNARTCWASKNRDSLPRFPVLFRTGGYDGQFFYYIGRELFGGPPAMVDSPPFRRARIGLPLLAGPLLAAGEFGRMYGLPLTLLGIHLASVWCMLRWRAHALSWALIFALNPFSLLSFLVCTADGAALSFAVLGVLAFGSSSRWRGIAPVLFAAALLTKETFLVVPVALGAATILEEGLPLRTKLRALLSCVAATIPMLLWWHHVGFSFGLAATHGGFPMSGILAFMPHADVTRALLGVVLVLAIAGGSGLVWLAPHRAAGLVLLGTAALISMATASEYWAAISNISRLFTPMVVASALLANKGATTVLRRTRWLRRVMMAWAISLLALTLTSVLREATRHPLPFVIASAHPTHLERSQVRPASVRGGPFASSSSRRRCRVSACTRM